VTPRLIALLTAALMGAAVSASPQPQPAAVRVAWRDVAPIRPALESRGIPEASFDTYVAQVRADNRRRVREGDLDHLVHYLLQSTRITPAPRIEPALSARTLVESLAPVRRAAFLRRDERADPRA
jgi:hypothetical protein